MAEASDSRNAPSKSSPESPWSVSKLNTSVKGWIDRLGWLWIEGQLTQVNTKPSWRFSYLTLRDTQEQASVQLTAETSLLTGMQVPLKDGDRVVVLGKPSFYPGRGTFSMRVSEIRHVGAGELLARIEALRKQLASEGLFDPARKRPLPYLPTKVGLITGRGSAAERDVVTVAQGRWPEVQFEIINTPVQGPTTVPAVIEALGELDADPDVDVIIIARGGGSVEDLLPFSEEALQRAVADARTPVISAIGHEPDNPVLDNVADVRAATPTDAAKRAVPDVAQERMLIDEARGRMAAALRGWVRRERDGLASLRSRPSLADPMLAINRHREEVDRAAVSIRRDISHLLQRESQHVRGLRAQVSALGPAATLARGYAVVQVLPRDGSEPEVVTSIDQTPPGSQLRIRVGDGSITAAAMSTTQAD
ncbi:exodeoxyribonuclease VII large subunit [Corynebacterium ureicelerivorans]|uniref:Exodeoxyribonuclease 7 large subunit n=1 Tax=Corynebacterium ureicelerivorans TaxID=401472 RepID=A0A077HHS1_9CORY|nr:exodeoxyribonuclease VII large subunit [Corynebacterium ureicelerivorans]AIL96613.1 exodeoxyribonuclease VII large subunit [Corynebacterium ureicelerivorans]